MAARARAVGYLAKRTSAATKTDTPLIDTPQSVSVVTKEQIRDQSFQSVGDVVRYVPGVIPHQGEGNRDDVVIRGQRSNADFFVNGVRDDVQYFRDLYNIKQIEVLKGPNAMIFGRGGGGGVINRVLKGADGLPVREVTFQGGHIHRYGVNPVIAFRPSDSTKVELSYEHFHDDRTAERGIPSQFGRPYNYRANTSTFFGNPDLNQARVDANIATATVEHETDAGLKIKSQLRYADYDKFYQNSFPGGAVNAAGTSVNLSAYNNTTNRENLFSQNDFTYKFETGFMKHTLLAGFELGQQTGLSYRQSGF